MHFAFAIGSICYVSSGQLFMFSIRRMFSITGPYEVWEENFCTVPVICCACSGTSYSLTFLKRVQQYTTGCKAGSTR